MAAEPPGATVTVCRIVERDRRLVEIPVSEYRAPIEIALARGSWSCRIVAPGHATVVLPISLGRGEPCTATVSLPPSGALGPDDVLVPGGAVEIGGDPEAADAWSRRRTGSPASRCIPR